MSHCDFIERPRTTCAHGGALATIEALPDVVAISHAAEGCGGNLTNAINACAGNNGEGYAGGGQIPSSAVREKDIIFGGVDRLEEEIRTAGELMDAKLFVVVTGCMTEMIGDDVESVTNQFEDAETPVIAVSTPSFEGDAYVGYERVLNGIFNGFLKPAARKKKNLVNLFGVVPAFDPYYRGDLQEIAELLRKVGLEVNTFFTPDQKFSNIENAPKAALNIVFSRVWGVDFAEKFKDLHGTPYWITDLPIGAQQTSAFLKELPLHIEVDEKLVKKVIRDEEKQYYGYFTKILDVIMNSQLFYYGATVTNSNYAIPLALYLQNELGWQVDDVFVTDGLTEKKKNALKKAFEEKNVQGELVLERNTKEIAWAINKRHARNHGERYFDSHTPLYIVGSALEKYAAQDLGALTLAVSYPVYNKVITNHGYAGYSGGLRLLEDLITVPVAGK